jgi:hypothetical protein
LIDRNRPDSERDTLDRTLPATWVGYRPDALLESRIHRSDEICRGPRSPLIDDSRVGTSAPKNCQYTGVLTGCDRSAPLAPLDAGRDGAAPTVVIRRSGGL